MLRDAVGDALFLKMEGEDVVDVDDNDLVEVLCNLDLCNSTMARVIYHYLYHMRVSA